jgi:FHA domain
VSLECIDCRSGIPLGDDEVQCPVCLGPLKPFAGPRGPRTSSTIPAGPDEPSETSHRVKRCWNCDQPVPAPTNTVCLNPSCRRSLTPPAMLLRFSGGAVEVQPGQLRQLGRLGEFRWVFHGNANVSRMHALVGVERSGSAWVEPLATPNGTWLDGAELADGRRHPLGQGQRLRLAADVEAEVRLFPERAHPALDGAPERES